MQNTKEEFASHLNALAQRAATDLNARKELFSLTGVPWTAENMKGYLVGKKYKRVRKEFKRLKKMHVRMAKSFLGVRRLTQLDIETCKQSALQNMEGWKVK